MSNKAQNRKSDGPFDGDGDVVDLRGRNQDDYSDEDNSSVCSNSHTNDLKRRSETGIQKF